MTSVERGVQMLAIKNDVWNIAGYVAENAKVAFLLVRTLIRQSVHATVIWRTPRANPSALNLLSMFFLFINLLYWCFLMNVFTIKLSDLYKYWVIYDINDDKWCLEWGTTNSCFYCSLWVWDLINQSSKKSVAIKIAMDVL